MDQRNTMDVGVSVRGKVVLITGGLGGIGRACVTLFRAHGATVAFTYADGVEAEALAQAVVASDPERMSAHALDLRSAVSIQQCMDDVVQHWGAVHILINNAAVGSATVATYADDTATQDTLMLQINADGSLKMCQAFLAAAHETLTTVPRRIINFSSVGGGVQNFPGFRLSDGMSKAAVAFMTKQLAAELVHTAVDVFAICPGATNTPMFQASTLNQMTAEEQRAFTAALPKGRLIEPSDIASIVLFLASTYSTPMHGAVIDASMGLGVRPGMITERGH
jgi:NAD(P)-dependent dehydrogenase (short-subunit alcohol dehydrogenase family)